MKPDKDYKDTLNLPRTNFPMKANLAQNEPKMLLFWEKIGLVQKIYGLRGNSPRYTLHDGPPYANGHIHLGHALNKILKDIVIKSKTMAGHLSVYVPGWDCHGLPIEHQVDKGLGPKRHQVDKLAKRQMCREYAAKFVDIQREEFIRLGGLGLWYQPYLTMNSGYEATIIRELGKCVANGLVYRGVKPIYWCSSCQTALAEAEVEYQPHKSPSIYVKFPVEAESAKAKGLPENTSIIIWTTTPWTLPANLAIAVHPDYEYVLIEQGGEHYVVAKGLLEQTLTAFGWGFHPSPLTPHPSLLGGQLEGLKTHHPWIDRYSPVILGTHVTLEQGTGAVHTAPGHGQEDFEVGLRYGLEVYSPVDNQGKFIPEVEHFAGMGVWDANAAIINLLKERGKLLATQTIEHTYPHCWRCKGPVIFRATAQWFISMEGRGGRLCPPSSGDPCPTGGGQGRPPLREQALETIKQVQWHPAWGQDRLRGMLEVRPDWCISRQRSWGVPITAFYCENNHLLLSAEIMEHIAGQVERDGAEVWFAKSAAELLPPGTACKECGSREWRKEMDILDVWFESGVSHAVVLANNPQMSYPADLYLEGSDQHRGWFQSSLLAGLGANGFAPYKAVLTHGFTVDSQGKKMSKSSGNVIAPQEIVDKYGAEILRLWVAGEDYREDMRISQQIIERLVEAYRRIRNTCRFMLGNLNDFDPRQHRVPYQDLSELDRWALHKLQELIKQCRRAYDRFTFHVIYHELYNFCTVELSAVYLDILKDRLYCSAPQDKIRRAAQTVLWDVLTSMLTLMAPIISFTAEEAWLQLPEDLRGCESVHMADLPQVKPEYVDNALAERWDKLLEIRTVVNTATENARKLTPPAIGSGLEAKVTLYTDEGYLKAMEGYAEDELANLFIVSQVVKPKSPNNKAAANHLSLGQNAEGTIIAGVDKAAGEKCARCWKYDVAIGQNQTHPDLCPRCAKVL